MLRKDILYAAGFARTGIIAWNGCEQHLRSRAEFLVVAHALLRGWRTVTFLGASWGPGELMKVLGATHARISLRESPHLYWPSMIFVAYRGGCQAATFDSSLGQISFEHADGALCMRNAYLRLCMNTTPS